MLQVNSLIVSIPFDNPIIRTGKSKHKDSKHELLHKREEEVTTILQSNSWKELVAAHV